MANTTWSTTDKTAGVTLSNTNHTATASAASNAIRTTDDQITGKFYWETTLTTASNSYAVGVAAAGAALATVYSAPAAAIIVYATGAIWRDGVSTGLSLGSLAAGGVVVCHALDATNGLYWARSGAAGNWNGSASANPATGVGGISTWGSGIPLYPAACFGVAAATTANFGDSAFTGTAPSGFTSGFTSGAAPVVNAVATQIGAEVWAAGEPALRVTQMGIEMWATVGHGDVQIVVSQIGLEVWRSVADAAPLSTGGPMISIIL